MRRALESAWRRERGSAAGGASLSRRSPILTVPSQLWLGVACFPSWLELTTLGDVVERRPPSDRVYLPTASYGEMGEWALRTACRDAAEGRIPGTIAVNLSPKQFARDDLAEMIHGILLESGLSPRRLVIEITESKPISKTKNWVATRLVEKAAEV